MTNKFAGMIPVHFPLYRVRMILDIDGSVWIDASRIVGHVPTGCPVFIGESYCLELDVDVPTGKDLLFEFSYIDGLIDEFYLPNGPPGVAPSNLELSRLPECLREAVTRALSVAGDGKELLPK